MWFESILRKETGCVTYMVGSTVSGECAVFDPLWDVAPYLRMAASKSSRIRYIIDSHSHADHVSVICAAGARSSTACGVLLRNGFRRVRNVAGGMGAWAAAGLPMVDATGEPA